MLEKEFTENSSNESLHLWQHETLIKGKSRCSQVFWCALEQVTMIRPTIIHGRALFYFQSFCYWLYLRASFTTHVLKKIELLLKTISVRHNLWHGWSSVITQSIIYTVLEDINVNENYFSKATVSCFEIMFGGPKSLHMIKKRTWGRSVYTIQL